MPLMLQGGPPETTGYLVLGLMVVAVLIIGFVASMVIRNRNLHRDMEMFEQLEGETERPTP